jgi:hypothetical protein
MGGAKDAEQPLRHLKGLGVRGILYEWGIYEDRSADRVFVLISLVPHKYRGDTRPSFRVYYGLMLCRIDQV